MANIEIKLNAYGMGQILIDGHDIANVTYKTTVLSEVGEQNRVILELWAQDIKVTAPAEVVMGLRDPVIEHLKKDLSDEDIERLASLVADILSHRVGRMR